MTFHLTLALTFLVLAVAAPAAAEEPHPFSARDLVTMDRVSNPRVSPDGRLVAFEVRSTDLAANRGRKDIWLVPADGSAPPRQLTRHEANDSEPLWAVDGESLYFLSARSGSSQVWRLPIGGGEARQVTDLPLDLANLVLAPDGSRLAFTMDVFPDCDTPACTAERLKKGEENQASGRLYDRLLARHWDTWDDGRRSHLFTLELDEAGNPGGDPVDVTAGWTTHVPPRPFGGAEEITFTPDASGLVFTARGAGREEAWSTDLDLFLAPADGSAPPRDLTPDNAAALSQPTFSPDGGTLACLAMSRPGYEADRFRVLVRPWADGAAGAAREVAPGWDRSPGSLTFSPDGGTLYVTADDLGHHPLFAVDVAGGAVRRVVGEGTVRAVAVAGDRLVFARDHLRSPVELFTIAPDGSGEGRLTDINRERLAAVQMGEPEQFRFEGAGGAEVYGWVVKPADFREGGKYPVAFLIHGGPQGSFGNDFHYRWNPQVYAGAGYGAVMIDFHGSTGYGQAFTDAIRGDWGGKPLEDLRRGLAAALERYPWLDGERACALGASYGGYMINWIAGQWPDGFRCLVNHDGIFDQRMMYYATEELWFPEWEQGGPYWRAAESYEKHNPLHHVEKWRTPMLVIHGALDYRVPETQSLATFTALQRRGIPSQLLHFPDENHWVLKPANSIQWHDTVLAWLERWLEE